MTAPMLEVKKCPVYLQPSTSSSNDSHAVTPAGRFSPFFGAKA